MSSPTAVRKVASVSLKLTPALIPWEGGSARPRIVACLERFQTYKEAEEVEAAGWMLTAIRERLSEQNLPDWERLQVVADKAAELLEPKPSTH